MAKQVKKVYRILAWFFSVVIATGTLIGCGKYGPPPQTKYGPPQPSGYSDTTSKTTAQK